MVTILRLTSCHMAMHWAKPMLNAIRQVTTQAKPHKMRLTLPK